MLNEQELSTLSELGSLQFTAKECEIMLNIKNVGVQILKNDTPEYLAYNSGRLKKEVEVRKKIISQAVDGSSPAQEQFIKYTKILKNNNSVINKLDNI